MTTKFKSRLIAIAFICCAVCVATWFSVLWWPQYIPDDFQQCSEKAQTTAASKDRQISLIAQCDKQFAGRRKVGGRYAFLTIFCKTAISISRDPTQHRAN